MRGSKPAGFSGVGERAACSLDRVSRRRGPRRAALVRVLSSAISSTMCAASENTAAVTMPARWWVTKAAAAERRRTVFQFPYKRLQTKRYRRRSG
jgi:hypothetical protein